mmetsp:Transcript_11534/g.22947  ORF Transcript_11534/g.22947 Transcript_11534/m.22947 type:complete len:261 (-) Transcript_11534:320-1102(-)
MYAAGPAGARGGAGPPLSPGPRVERIVRDRWKPRDERRRQFLLPLREVRAHGRCRGRPVVCALTPLRQPAFQRPRAPRGGGRRHRLRLRVGRQRRVPASAPQGQYGVRPGAAARGERGHPGFRDGRRGGVRSGSAGAARLPPLLSAVRDRGTDAGGGESPAGRGAGRVRIHGRGGRAGAGRRRGAVSSDTGAARRGRRRAGRAVRRPRGDARVRRPARCGEGGRFSGGVPRRIRRRSRRRPDSRGAGAERLPDRTVLVLT